MPQDATDSTEQAPPTGGGLATLLDQGLDITLQRDIRQARLEAAITSRRLVHAARILEGRPADQAVATVRTLFAICGTAHHAAAAGAVDSLREPPPDSPTKAEARSRAMVAESLREHLLRVHLDWPLLMRRNPDPRALSRIAQLCNAAVRREAASADLQALRRFVEGESLGMPLEAFAQMDSMEALMQWAKTGEHFPAARMLAWTARLHWDPVWDMPLPLGGALDEIRLDLEGDDAAAFVECPTLQGECRETGPIARQAPHPLIRNLADKHGAAVLARLTARLLDVAGDTLELLGERPARPWGTATDGMAVVEASRGTLMHLVELDAQERVSRYRILAPTEWNFHPRGAAARLLASIDGRRENAQIRTCAHVAVQAIDPCVAYALHLRDIAHAGPQDA